MEILKKPADEHNQLLWQQLEFEEAIDKFYDRI
jgi:hypothetical protein